MSGWSKSFEDGSVICQNNEETESHLTWANTPLDSMRGASAHINNCHLAISGLGDYWLSDEIVGNKVVTRRIMKQLDAAERVMQVLQTQHSVMLRVIDVRTGAGSIMSAQILEAIPQDKAGQWLVLEYSVKDEKFRWFYSPERF